MLSRRTVSQQQLSILYTQSHDKSVQILAEVVGTRSSAIAGRPCDAKACQGLLKWTWKWQPSQKWPSNVIKSGTNRKLLHDILLVVTFAVSHTVFEKLDVKQSNDLEICQRSLTVISSSSSSSSLLLGLTNCSYSYNIRRYIKHEIWNIKQLNS